MGQARQKKAAMAGSRSKSTSESAGGHLTVHFSSQTPEWTTPPWLFDALDKEFGFTLDPCSTHTNAKCAKHFIREDNGLAKSWRDEVVFMNPPYGAEISDWMEKAHASASQEAATVVCLIAARTDTTWWQQYAMKHEIRLLRGRLKFGDGRNSAPFPSAGVVMRAAGFALRAWPARPAVQGSLSFNEQSFPTVRGPSETPAAVAHHGGRS